MSARRYFPFFCALPFLLGACATIKKNAQPEVALYSPKPIFVEEGLASWYRDHRTASGEPFKLTALAAAHKKLPFGSKVRVIDLKTKKSIIVRINDRGPYIRGRIIDLTVGAARQLGVYERGIARVRIEVLKEIPIIKKPNLRDKPVTKPATKPVAKPKTAARRS